MYSLQERVLGVVLTTLLWAPMYLAHSLVEITTYKATETTVRSAIVGVYYLAYMAVFGFVCQWFYSEVGVRSNTSLF